MITRSLREKNYLFFEGGLWILILGRGMGVYKKSFRFWWVGFQVGSISLYVDALRNSWFCYVCIVPIVYRMD
jgi:hypothetical protein